MLTRRIAVRRLLERSPEAYVRWLRWRGNHPTPLQDDSELLVDGFPSSANSYVRSWILFANPEARVASHEHSPAVVTAAVRRRIPVVVPYRDPVDAVTSMLTRFPHFRMSPPHGPRRLLRWYASYHRGVLRRRDGVVLVPFEQATSDLTPTIGELNRRFGTGFVPLAEEHWPKVMEYLHAKDAVLDDGDTRVAAPSAAKEQAKHGYREQVEAPALDAVRRDALAVYEELRAATPD